MHAPARSSFRTIALLAAIPVLGLAAFFLWQWWNGGETPSETYDEAKAVLDPRTRPSPPHTPARQAAVPAPAKPATVKKLPRVRNGSGEIVLIIDDLGFDGQPLDRLMALDPNLNCSILPNGTRAADFARKLNERGFEILCHLPMEPEGGEQPGANAILTSMPDDEIARLTRENIAAIPHARGVNNHMGSRATRDRRVMTTVLRAMPSDLYFIDSRTSGRSIAAEVAHELNVPTATRQVFLDDVLTERAVRKQVRELAASAQKHGVAIGIGHPHPVTIRVLAEEMPELRASGLRFVRASEVVR